MSVHAPPRDTPPHGGLPRRQAVPVSEAPSPVRTAAPPAPKAPEASGTRGTPRRRRPPVRGRRGGRARPPTTGDRPPSSRGGGRRVGLERAPLPLGHPDGRRPTSEEARRRPPSASMPGGSRRARRRGEAVTLRIEASSTTGLTDFGPCKFRFGLHSGPIPDRVREIPHDGSRTGGLSPPSGPPKAASRPLSCRGARAPLTASHGGVPPPKEAPGASPRPGRPEGPEGPPDRPERDEAPEARPRTTGVRAPALDVGVAPSRGERRSGPSGGWTAEWVRPSRHSPRPPHPGAGPLAHGAPPPP